MNPGTIWPLDPGVIFLNHGSFGSCPKPVLEFQNEIRARMEREPVDFYVRAYEGLWDEARSELSRLIGADTQNLVFVANATTGINTVLNSLDFKPGDELLVTDHEYNACRNALNRVAERSGAIVVVACIPFPLERAGQITEALWKHVTARTRLLLVDHVSSQTGLIFPVKEILDAFAQKGIDVLVDGAHAPGMVPLNLEDLKPAFYTGNCHKWLCGPKSAAFLYVRPDLQKRVRPLTISHGANSQRRDRSRFLIEFGWMGTSDPTALLSVPYALKFLASQRPGGWTEIMETNRALALRGRQILCDALQIPAPCPDSMIGSLASVPIPDARPGGESTSPLYGDPDQDKLRERYGIEVPIIPWPRIPKRLIRISAQLYNELRDYEALRQGLQALGLLPQRPKEKGGSHNE